MQAVGLVRASANSAPSQLIVSCAHLLLVIAVLRVARARQLRIHHWVQVPHHLTTTCVHRVVIETQRIYAVALVVQSAMLLTSVASDA